MKKVSFLFALVTFLSARILLSQVSEQDSMHCQTKAIDMPNELHMAYKMAMQNPTRYKSDSIIIPVIVHNLSWNRKGYVADSLIHPFLARTNDALANRGEFYDPEGLDTRIRLCLAAKDTLGRATSGILHYEHLAAINRSLLFERSIVWDINTYLNLYLSESSPGVGQFPWNTEGVFQGIMISTSILHRKRGVITMTHELGHYLGLWHTYEDFFNACSNQDCLDSGDFVCDTRFKDQGFAYCFETNTCISDVNPDDPNNPFTEEDVESPFNYMDAGTCRTRFTPGQVARMHWAAETFLPSHKSSGRSLCNTCNPVEVDFSFDEDFALSGESILVSNKTIEKDLNFVWFINDVEYQIGFETKFTFDEEGFYRIRLEAQDEDCGIWSHEKTLHVRCSDEAFKIDYPEILLQDSCYSFHIQGVPDLIWQFEGQMGNSTQFKLCMPERGIFNLYLSFEQGSCQKYDSLKLFVYNNSDLSARSYSHDVMKFEGERLLQENVHVSQIGFDNYLIAGLNTTFDVEHPYNIFSSLSPVRNFVRSWHPKFDYIEEWEIYEQNTLSEELTDSLLIQGKLEVMELYKDKDGFTYILSRHGYILGNKWGFYLMKLDALGNVVWNKLVYPRIEQDVLFTRDNVQIQEVDNELLICYGEFFLRLNKDGSIVDSGNLVRGPNTNFPSGILSWINRDSNEEVIFQFNQDSEPFTEEPDSLGFFSIDSKEQLMITIYTHDFELVTEQVYTDNFFSDLGTLKVKAQENGAVFYFRSSDDTDELSDLETVRHYFIKLNDQGDIIWKKAYENLDSQDRRDRLSTAFLDVLENGDIVCITPILDGRYTAYLRLDSDGNLIENRHYKNSPPFKPLIRTVDLNQASKIGIRSKDGYLIAANKGRNFHEALIFQHIPLDGTNDSCAYTDTMRMVEIAFELKEDETTGFMHEIPMQIEIEDAPISVRKTNYSSMSICGTSIELEDYSFAVIDTTCIDNEMKIELEICRQKIEDADTVSLLIFEQSPFDSEGSLFQSTQIEITKEQTCTQLDLFLPSGEYHFLVNAKAEYRRPYTFDGSFFDGAEKLEYDYLNNILQVDLCAESVSVTENTERVPILDLYPNPSRDQLYIGVENSQIKRIEVFDLLGQRILYDDNLFMKNNLIDIRHFATGAYLIQAELSRGEVLTGRFVKI